MLGVKDWYDSTYNLAKQILFQSYQISIKLLILGSVIHLDSVNSHVEVTVATYHTS